MRYIRILIRKTNNDNTQLKIMRYIQTYHNNIINNYIYNIF